MRDSRMSIRLTIYTEVRYKHIPYTLKTIYTHYFGFIRHGITDKTYVLGVFRVEGSTG